MWSVWSQAVSIFLIVMQLIGAARRAGLSRGIVWPMAFAGGGTARRSAGAPAVKTKLKARSGNKVSLTLCRWEGAAAEG